MDSKIQQSLEYLKMLAIIRQFGPQPFDEVQWASRLIFEFLPDELPGLSKDDFETPNGYMEYLSRIKPSQQVNSIWGQGGEFLDYLVENDIIRRKSMTYGELTLESELYSSLLRPYPKTPASLNAITANAKWQRAS